MEPGPTGSLGRINRLTTLLAEASDPAFKRRVRARLARERKARSQRLDADRDSGEVRRA